MLSLGTVVAISASSAATFIVAAVVGIVVWVRVRKERHALAVLKIRQGLYGSETRNTLTELSMEEGSALREHGQLPYGKPTEWGLLKSQRSLLRPKNNSDSSFSVAETARSLRHSLSRSRSNRLSKSSHKHSRLSSLATLDERYTRRLSTPPPKGSFSKEEIPLSAVEGVLELPAERTPKQTPEIDDDDTEFHGMRPVSQEWPLASQRNRSSLCQLLEGHSPHDIFDALPKLFDESSQRLRGGSITSQTAGAMPEQPVPPPPPAAYQSNRSTYTRNDSVMRLSSLSVDTTDSSILDDGRNCLPSADTDVTSPINTQGGTFVPFSPNDVGVMDGRRSFIADNTSMPPIYNLPIRSSSTSTARTRSIDLTAPRRSMTTRCSSNTSELSSIPSRRSEDLSSNPHTRHTSLRGGAQGAISKHSSWRLSGSQAASLPHFSPFPCHTVYEGEQQDNDPFYGSSAQPLESIYRNGSPAPNPTGILTPQSPMQRSSLSIRGPPPSALKSGNSQRKGHRRQNCVRISIHPPVAFGGPTFSPTVEEEPEELDEMEELDLRESAINGPPKTQPQTPISTTSPFSTRNKYGSRRTKLAPGSLGPLAEEPQPSCNKSPCKKRKLALVEPTDTDPLVEKNRALPEITTSLPSSTVISLTHTPSPERNPPVWAVSENTASPTYENSPSTGSPRRSAVKGPRSQPRRATRSSTVTAEPTEHVGKSTGSPGRQPFVTATQKSKDSLYRNKTDAGNRSYRRYRDSQDTLASDLGSSIDPSSKRSSTIKDRVTIWEDVTRGRSPPKPSPSVNIVEATASSKSSRPRSFSKDDQPPSRMPSQRAPPTPTSARCGLTTPTGKGVGLGIGCTTPASLYDGDGFLKE